YNQKTTPVLGGNQVAYFAQVTLHNTVTPGTGFGNHLTLPLLFSFIFLFLDPFQSTQSGLSHGEADLGFGGSFFKAQSHDPGPDMVSFLQAFLGFLTQKG